MIDAVVNAFKVLVGFLVQWPEFFIIPLGITIALLTSTGAYLVWFPDKWSQKDCFKAMSAIDIPLTFFFCSRLWHFMDPHDLHGLIDVVSLGAALCCTAIHVLVIRTVTHRWPWIEASAT